MTKNNILLALAIVIYGIFFIPNWDIHIKALGALLVVQILWIGRVFPLAFSSLILILILSFHFFTYDETLSYFGSSLVWLLFSTFILSYAFIKTGLASRVSLKILALAKGSSKALIFVSFMMEFVLTVFIPSNIGKGQLVSSILNDLINNLRKIQETENLGKSLFIGIAYVSAISAAFVPTGASSTIYAYGMFSSVSDQINYFTWILYIGVPIVVFILILWVIFLSKFPVHKVNFNLVNNLIDSKMKELGNWKPEEIRMAIIIGLTLSLWLTQPIHHQPIPLIGLLGAVFVVLPYIGVMNWDEAKKGINWDMMIFFAATLMLSNMLIETGTLNGLTNLISQSSQNHSNIYIIISFIIVTSLIRIVFVNVLGFLTIMLPLAITLGQQIEFSPLLLAMGVYLAGVPGFLLITQSPVHLISYSYHHFETRDLLKSGVIALPIWLVIIISSIFLYWSLII
ncbi:SLC13 family permease [Piscibacillus halophilus]|uniref:SLC13 family permease n=1 Tax=Piscibacillus halophilus TaxID=571933 RepID=UPI00158D4564|nr:SLC13 family permease [Piscibacillus halophilus]